MIRNLQLADNLDEDKIYDEIELINKRLDENELQNFEASFSNRRTYNKVNYAKPVLISLGLVFLIITLIFGTNNIIDISTEDIATIKSENNTTRGIIIEQVNSAVEQSIPETVATLSMSGVDYYIMEIPSNYTIEEIGGYALPNYGKPHMSNEKIKSIVGGTYGFGRHSTLEYILSGSWSSVLKDCARDASYDDTGCAQINGRYLAAIGGYFFPDDKKYIEFSISSTGYCFDVVLKDGTTIPFIKFDSKANSHTNGSSIPDDGTYTRGEIKMDQYAHLFQALDGSIVEIMAKEAASINTLRNKYRQSDDNPIVQIIMYNTKYK